jgi:hypothetical protein
MQPSPMIKRALSATLAAGLLFGAAACGDDDDGVDTELDGGDIGGEGEIEGGDMEGEGEGDLDIEGEGDLEVED